MKKSILAKTTIVIGLTLIWILIIYALAIIIHNKFGANTQDCLTFFGLIFCAIGIFTFVDSTYGGAMFKNVDMVSMRNITIETESARNGKGNYDFLRGIDRRSVFSFKFVVIGMTLGGLVHFLGSIMLYS